MRILSLDLGTNTGWAVGQDGKLVDCGTWKLATAKEIKVAGLTRMNRRLDPRIPALWGNLFMTEFSGHALDWIVFEDVQFSSSTQQTQLWSSFRGVVWTFASVHHAIKVECLPTGKLKLFGAGHGGATKEMMAAHLLTGSDPRFFLDATSSLVQFTGGNGTKILDDNAVDAVHLLHWAMKTLKNA